jgi:dTDP-glucose 4,6-dehydratase
MTLLVTGGAGFIGSNFVLDWLAQSDEPVINLDKLTYAGNLREPRQPGRRCAPHLRPRRHRRLRPRQPPARPNTSRAPSSTFAAESHVDRSIHGPGEFIQTNIVGTFQLLEAVRAYWGGLPDERKTAFRLLHVSTDEVYGSLSKTDPAFTETHRYEPNSPYSASKAASDHLVRAYHHTYGLPVLTTNCSNNYGPYHFPEKLIPLLIVNSLGRQAPARLRRRPADPRLALRQRPLQRHPLRPRRGKSAKPTTSAAGTKSPTSTSCTRFAHLLDELRPRPDGKPYKDQITYVTDRPGHDRRYAIDARKLERELGWKPAETFETGIRKTVQWYLDNQPWVENVLSGSYRDWVAKQYGA